MYFDAVTMASMRDELYSVLLWGRVQATIEIDELTVGFEIYGGNARHYLLVSAHPHSARIHLNDEKLRRGVSKPSPLGLLMRKYLSGSRLVDIYQPPHERILEFSFSGDEGETLLICEIMDNRSNIILSMGGIILDAIKRVSSEHNRYRVILPNKPYVPPPPQKKQDPVSAKASDLQKILLTEPNLLVWQALVNTYKGISPQFARELAYRLTGATDALLATIRLKELTDLLQEIFDSFAGKNWEPGVAGVPNGEGYNAFSAYRLTHQDNWQSRQTLSHAIRDYFRSPISLDPYAPGKSLVSAEINNANQRVQRKLKAFHRQILDVTTMELLKIKGEMLFTYAFQIKQGSESFDAEIGVEGERIRIDLDPELSAVENAQRYIEKYQKAKKAQKGLPDKIHIAEQELIYLEQLAYDLNQAESWPEIDEIKQALIEAGFWQGKKTKSPSGGITGIRRFTTPDGFVILVGRNAIQNHKLLTQLSKKEDIWLHARDIPGSHVLIRHDGRPIPRKVIDAAARFAAYYSSGRNETLVPIVVTERKFVKPIKGAGLGLVTFRNEETIAVSPDMPDFLAQDDNARR